MKSEHRHELKTNELAEWIANFPQWFQENMMTVIIGVVIVAGLIVYTVFYYHREGRIWNEKDARTASMLDQLSMQKQTAAQGKQQGLGVSDLFLNSASALQTAAGETENPILSGLAMIKRAESLRTELQYRPQMPEPDVRKYQDEQAKKAYEDALAKVKGDPTVSAMAEYGIALCLEDMGDFAGAKTLYNKIAENPEYKGTLYPARAKLRAQTLVDNESKVVFAKSEKPPELPAGQPQMKPVGPLRLDGPMADTSKTPAPKSDINLPK
jgi:hypothetical protein